ncbi:MAG: hypothetical protein KGN16_17730 [Burkholderiales bacterium]|nr:hypothetical protein [Burkholderiales bacterium]
MNITMMTTPSPSPSHAWRYAFADALIRLQPDLNPDAADELSDAAYLCHADLDPRDAAELYGRGAHVQATRASQPARWVAMQADRSPADPGARPTRR